MKKVYVVDDCNTGELRVYVSKEEAARYVRNYYREHMTEWYGDYGNENTLGEIKADFDALLLDLPYIDAIMYIHEADLLD